MKTLRKYQNGGIAAEPPETFGGGYSDILKSLAKLILDKGGQGIEALQDALGVDEASMAMDEFNEAADQMPSARQEGGDSRPDRRDMAPMQKMRPRGLGFPVSTFKKRDENPIRNVEKEVAMKDKSVFRPQPSRSIGEGIEPRKRRFRRR